MSHHYSDKVVNNYFSKKFSSLRTDEEWVNRLFEEAKMVDGWNDCTKVREEVEKLRDEMRIERCEGEILMV